MDIYFVIVLVFSATFLILFLLLRHFRRRWDPTFKRMRELAQWPEESGASAPVVNDAGKAKARAGLARLLELAGRRSGGDNRSGNKMRKSLMSAGYYSDSALRTYMGIKRVFAMISFALFFYLGMIGSQPLYIVLLLAVAGALVFYVMPEMVLKSRARRRQAAVAAGLPDALDLMVICVEAGLGLNAAIMRVGQDLAMRCRPLSDEFIRVTRDLRTGSSREKALRALSQRNQVEDLKILVGALVLADKLGTSIADTLRAQADSLRTRIKQKAEEQAAKAGIKMLLPLVLFILPALFIILMGPAALMMLESLSQ